MKMLRRESFGAYVWRCYFLFLRREGPYTNAKIKDFEAKDSVNRNSEQVPELLWQKILQRHLKIHNYN